LWRHSKTLPLLGGQHLYMPHAPPSLQLLGFVEVVRREGPRERHFLQAGSPQGSDTLSTLLEGMRFVLCASPEHLEVLCLLCPLCMLGPRGMLCLMCFFSSGAVVNCCAVGA
jgi:hypothetical protein